MRYIILFSGIEAASAAWMPLGWEAAAFCEVDPFCGAVLAARFPAVPNLGDIRIVDWRHYHGKANIAIGGSPCQSFSVAGRREGLAGESGLMLEYIRAVRQILPRCLVWENVPGALSSEGGEAFATAGPTSSTEAGPRPTPNATRPSATPWPSSSRLTSER